MTRNIFSDDQLIGLIAAYGADLSAWPDNLAASAAQQVTQAGPAVRAALDEAAALDAMLSSLPEVEPPAHLAAAILDAAPARKSPEARRSGWLSWLGVTGMPVRAGAALASLAIGLSVGFGTAAASAPSADDFDHAMSKAINLEYDGDFADFLEMPE